MKKYKETCKKTYPKKSGKATKKTINSSKTKGTKSAESKSKSTNSTARKVSEVSKQKCVDSQQPGPSAYYVDNSNEDFDSDIGMSDKEEDLCCVCKKFSPEGLKNCIDIVIVKWGQCDNCGHWTHLRFCSNIRVLRRHSEFLCPCCEN